MPPAAARHNRRFAADSERSYGLPPTFYTDPSIYAKEREAIFFRTWQFAGSVADLPDVGSYITATIVDQGVVVVRDKSRRLRAYYNVCPHRGHEVVSGSGRRTILTCPYHAWSFDLDGTLRAAGNSENVKGFDPAEFGLTEIRVEEFANLVFVNFASEGPSLAEQAGPLADEMRAVIPDFDSLRPFRRDPFDIAANWKIVIENFLECYHCPVVHPGVMGEEDANLKPSWESDDFGCYSRHIIRAHSPEEQASSRKALPFAFRQDGGIKDGHLWSLWPNTCFIARPGDSNFQVFHVMPTGPARVHETLVNFGRGGTPEAPELAVFDRFRDELNRQDIDVVESVQRGMHSRGYLPGRLMVDPERSWRSEASVHHFDRMVWEAVDGAADA